MAVDIFNTDGIATPTGLVKNGCITINPGVGRGNLILNSCEEASGLPLIGDVSSKYTDRFDDPFYYNNSIRQTLEEISIFYAKLSETPGSLIDSGPNGFILDELAAGGGLPFSQGLTDVGTGIDFDISTSDRIKINDNALLNLSHSFTIDGWIKKSSGGTNRTIISKWDFDNNKRSWFVYSPSDTSLSFLTSNNGVANTSVSLSGLTLGNTTHYFTAILNTDTLEMSLRINFDEKQAITPSAFIPFPGSIFDARIAALQTSTNLFDGVIHDIGIFNRVLTEKEIEWRYNSGVGNFLF